MKYSEVKQLNSVLTECFFAFSDEQFAAGKAKLPEDERILGAGAGLFGTFKGLKLFHNELYHHKQMIINNCDPQDIYNYEFSNHECGYTGDDSDALEILHSYFPDAIVERFPAHLMEDV